MAEGAGPEVTALLLALIELEAEDKADEMEEDALDTELLMEANEAVLLEDFKIGVEDVKGAEVVSMT